MPGVEVENIYKITGQSIGQTNTFRCKKVEISSALSSIFCATKTAQLTVWSAHSSTFSATTITPVEICWVSAGMCWINESFYYQQIPAISAKPSMVSAGICLSCWDLLATLSRLLGCWIELFYYRQIPAISAKPVVPSVFSAGLAYNILDCWVAELLSFFYQNIAENLLGNPLSLHWLKH